MRARIIAVGDRMPAWVAQGFAEYKKRLGRGLTLELIEIKPSARDRKRGVIEEGEALLAAAPRAGHLIALHGRGEPWSSEELADRLRGWRMQGSEPAFLIGGADGHGESVLARAAQCWSLGPLTLPHMLVRLVVAEQLYRAATILAGHPYHRG